MFKNRSKLNRKNGISRVKLIIFLLVFVLAVSISIPSLARYKNYVNLENLFNEIQTWDGSVASSYSKGNGTIDSPYIISNASELAFFSKKLENTDYAGIYFELGNDIVINDGLFGYDGTNISYESDGTKFYIEPGTTNVYENAKLTGNIISNINIFKGIENFKGYFDGNYYTVYGLYITGNKDNLSLFENVSGTLKNVYLENSFVYGGSKTSILANNVVNSTISDVLVDGLVVGTGANNEETIISTLDDVSVIKDSNEYNGVISFDRMVNEPTKIVLKGNYSSSVEGQVITINGEEVNVGDFSINLDNSVNEVPIIISDELESEILLSNLVIESSYNYAIASGIASYSENVTYHNVINKADIYGVNVSGLFGIMSNVNVTHGYNTGNLTGTNVSAFIGQVINDNSSVIDKVYNIGSLTGTKTSLIDTVYNSNSFVVGNSFNTKELSSTFNNVLGKVSVSKLYDINSKSVANGELTGNVSIVTLDKINKSLLVDTLGMSEYVDDNDLKNNANNAWIYAFEEYPILYMDTLNNPIASINVGTESWNDLGFNVKELKFTESKAFNVTPVNGYSDFKNIYYYVYESKEAIDKSEIEKLEWNTYDGVVSLNKEGYYIIYVKVVDQEDRVYYLNSDCLFFDLLGPNVEIKFEDYLWNSRKEVLNSVYINDPVDVNISAIDDYSAVGKVYYYVSDVYLSLEELKQFNDWSLYEDKIVIDKVGSNIVNVKAIDINGHETYVNSDYIVYGGYEGSLNIGMNSNQTVETANVTSRSSVIYSFNYNDDINYSDGYNSNLVLSNKLPVGTIITMMDRVNNGIYSYVVKEEDDTLIPLKSFAKLGNVGDDSFDDVAYIITDKKDLSFVIDFNKAVVDSDFSFNVSLDLRDSKGNVVLSTLKDSLKDTNVYADLEKKIKITTSSTLYGINYDSNSSTDVKIEYEFNSLVKDGVVITDTYYDNKKTGIAINLEDRSGNVIDKKYLKNMEFIVGGVNYSADSDGIVRINMSDDLSKVNSTLTVVTYENNLDLKDGNYSLVITPFVANDGKYSSSYFDSCISIPVVSDYKDIFDYEFNVKIDDANKILIKATGNASVDYKVSSKHKFENASLRVSLYKKKEMTAYDQTYEIIDLKEYVSNDLELIDEYSYVVENGKLTLDFDLTKFEKRGYEVRFDLYDGDTKIESIKKKFIIK